MNVKKIWLIGFLGISLFVNILLSVYMVKREPVCERVHLDDVSRERNVIPDEKTARQIAYIIVESNFGFEENYFYDPFISYDEDTGEWEVSYLKRTKEGGFILCGGMMVRIDRNSGMITELYYSY